MKRKLRRRFDIIVSAKPVFFKFNFGGWGYSPADPPCFAPQIGFVCWCRIGGCRLIYFAENKVHYWDVVDTKTTGLNKMWWIYLKNWTTVNFSRTVPVRFATDFIRESGCLYTAWFSARRHKLQTERAPSDNDKAQGVAARTHWCGFLLSLAFDSQSGSIVAQHYAWLCTISMLSSVPQT